MRPPSPGWTLLLLLGGSLLGPLACGGKDTAGGDGGGPADGGGNDGGNDGGTGDGGGGGDGGTTATDADGDGYDSVLSGDDDCDDNNADIHPGATEVCDGVDNNCDGDRDEDTAADASTWYYDGDGDGYGRPVPVRVACDQPPDYVPEGNDCDDEDPTRSPGRPELCDGFDNNCDGCRSSGATPARHKINYLE